MSMRTLAVSVAVVAALAGCGGGRATGADVFVGTWINPSDAPAERGSGGDRSYEVFGYRMAEHCNRESTVALTIAWPLGRTQHSGESADVHFYIRDPEDVTGSRAGLDVHAALPAGSIATGYRVGAVELWFGPDSGANFAYLVDGPDIERWPRTEPPPGCA